MTMLDPDTITTRAEDGLATFGWSYVIFALRSAGKSDVDRVTEYLAAVSVWCNRVSP
ncbi:hypothetical protein [Amycolatopsis coloradensis]|uniref:hypothetical protein n=1 Tax=Amycolatopsis coloradensis TaxID=76021 RepID=UPI001FC8EE99